MLKCGHPDGAWSNDEDYQQCLWCWELAGHQGQINVLREQLHKKAVVVNDGATLHIDGDVGLLEVHGGTVNMAAKSFGTTLGIPTIESARALLDPSPPPPEAY